jgi:uncharacterized protein (DUF1697 family)
MTRQAALLRAVNVGGRKLIMSELRAACQSAGYRNVRTLMASGNLVLEAKSKGAKLEVELEALIERTFGLKSEVFVRDAAALEAVMAANPFAAFAARQPSHLLVGFLKVALSAADIKNVEAPQQGPEQARVVGREVFITYPNGSGRSTFKVALKQPCTTRNWNTVGKLAAMTRAA